ncbi:MAG: translation initiation factor eIF-1A [Candidatus Micrarchaeia archaeon]
MFQKKRFHKKRHTKHEGPIRVRMPRENEIFGIVTELLGGSRMRVQCKDGHERLARIPGKIRRKLWIKVSDLVLVTPWSVESNEKADIAYRYTKPQVEQLRRRGIIKD